jgi:tetratricopeptide (TPR) repeat protein
VESIDLTNGSMTESSDLSGNEVSDHIDSLFGDDSMQHQPSGSPSLDITGNSDSELLTGNDLQDHLELLMPSDSPQSSMIEPDFNASIMETSLSSTNPDNDEASGISGNDFANHLDMLTNDEDKTLMNNDTSDDIQQVLLSMSDDDSATPADETLNGDDFASHMDSLLSSDDIQPDLQSGNDFSTIINIDNNGQDLLSNESVPGLENGDNSFMQGMEPELQSSDESSDNNLILDTSIRNDLSTPNSAFEIVSDVTPEEETFTGADFANHMDMLLGDEEASDQSIYNKISNNFDSGVSSPDTGTDDGIVSGDDIGNLFDKLAGELQSNTIEEPYETAQSVFEIDDSGSEPASDDNNVNGDDIVDKINIISSDFPSNQHSDFLELPDEQVNGSDVSDRIGALENEPFLTIDQVGPDGNTPDISPFVNTEFEETMQIDRSFIENVQSLSDKNIQEDDAAIQNVQVPPHVNPFEFENETIQIDRSELFAHHPDSVQNEGESLILDVENPTPNQDSLYVADDIRIEQDEQSISEMDVLVEPSKDIQYVTGEDVIDKLDNIFTEEDNGQEAPATGISGPMDIFASEAAADNTTEDTPDIASWPQALQQESSPAQNTDDLTGSDVEKRLEEFFSDSNDTVSKDNASYEESVEELEIADEYQDQGDFMLAELEDTMDSNEAQKSFDNKESTVPFDNSGVQSNFLENVNDGQNEGADNNAPLNGIDTRDKPYSIPDHVLTPTLADIYFQQGQYHLALQIYSRLIEKDPSNLNLQDRYDEIQTQLASQENQPGQFYDFGNEQEQSKGKKKSDETEKPLSGVRIKKSKKPKK